MEGNTAQPKQRTSSSVEEGLLQKLKLPQHTYEVGYRVARNE
jgi:hypothetical protein